MVATDWDAALPNYVEIVEVGPRDGFQNLAQFIETADKIRIIRELMAVGIPRIEVTSFVHPKAVPQMRDAEEILEAVRDSLDRCLVLVPNVKGAERAIAAGATMLNLVVSASESHNRSNVRMTVEESLEQIALIAERARQAKVQVRASVSTAFGCPYEGIVPEERVRYIAHRLVDLGCVELNLCDTTGMANPRQVARLSRRMREDFPEIRIAMHFHNTRGAGLANILAAMQNGITTFETSLGGLGGCPFAPGASGNVCTEDVVHMLHEMGIATGIDLATLIEVVREEERRLNLPLVGQVIRAGRACDLHPLPVS